MTTSTHPSPRGGHEPHRDDASVGELTSQLSTQVTRLVRDELALARIEAKDRARHLGLGVGMFGAGGVFGFLAVCCLVTAGILGVATAVAPWLAAIIVAAGLLVIAAVVALTGKKNLADGSPPVPTEAIESTKADVAAVREAVHR